MDNDGTAAEWVSIDAVTPWEDNPRKNDHAAKELAVFIREYGWGAPIIARRENGVIIAGHTRMKAAAILGLDKVPVRFVDVDERTAHMMALADNKLAEKAAWEPGKLTDLLSGFSLSEAEALGWDSVELEKLADEVDGFGPLDDAEEDGEIPEPPANPVTKLGDVWTLGDHRLLCGSCEDIAVPLADEKFSIMVTDPPYGVSYADKNKYLNAAGKGNSVQSDIANDHHAPEEMRELWTDWFRAVRPHAAPGAAYYVTGPQGGDLLLLLQSLSEADFPLRHMLIWAKNVHVLGRCDYQYKHEPIIYGWVEGSHHQVADRTQTSLWEINKPHSSKLHPTMKPVELYARAYRNSTRPGALAVEPFAGSGTAYIAAESLERRVAGTELSPAYCDVIVERWEQHTGGKATRG